MEKFINYILQFGHLNQSQIDLIKGSVKFNEISQGSFYQEAGDIPREVIFINEGVFRVCYYNEKGDEITKYFLDEYKLVADINCYNQGIASTEYVQAVTDCKYIALSKTSMDELSKTIVEWDKIIQKITAKGMATKINNISSMMSEDATERYLKFLSYFPNLANRIPLSYLASYIGITQSSLSRIRKKLH